MTGMEAVLAAHGGHEFGREKADASRWFDRCECGYLLFGIDYSPEHTVQAGKSYADTAFAAHLAQALTAAGYGSQHDAWADGHSAGWDNFIINVTEIKATPRANPYPPTEGATK